jgi:hypothetical protein
MRLHPNPPRFITVVVALVLVVVGLVFAWPIQNLVPIFHPLVTALASVGLKLDQDLAYLCLFASPCLLVAGSLLRGI